MLALSRLALTALAAVSQGASLHRAALEAVHERRWERTELLFEAALRRYRQDLEVEAIARLRVHQLVARVRSEREPSLEGGRCLEIERRLCQLDRIESMTPPFDLVEAHELIGNWRFEHHDGGRHPELPMEFARAS